MAEQRIGEVTHFFTDISVAIVELEGPLELGDEVRFQGATTDFEQEVSSIEIDREEVEEAETGDVIGLKVENRVREGDEVYRTG